jgi:DNA-binding GntR family transcriptional regulator
MKNVSLLEDTVGRVREDILRGRIRPGERVNIDGLARLLNTSKTPVREALNMLSAEKLVVYKPKLGYYIPTMTLREYIEASEIQEAVELHLHLKISETGIDVDYALLESINLAIAEAVEKRDQWKIFQLNELFHMTLYQRYGNKKLILELRRIWNELLIHRHHMFSSPTFLSLIARDHAKIIEAMKTGAPQSITEAVRNHFKSGIIGVSEDKNIMNHSVR